MSKKVIISTLSTIIAIGLGSQAIADDAANSTIITQNKTNEMLTKEMPAGFEKCYGISKAGQNDCASGAQTCASQSKEDGAKNAWVGVPKGACDKIVGGSTAGG